MYAFQFSSYDKNNFHKKLPTFESGTSLKPQISQKIFTSDFMLPDSKNFFDALLIVMIFKLLVQAQVSLDLKWLISF